MRSNHLTGETGSDTNSSESVRASTPEQPIPRASSEESIRIRTAEDEHQGLDKEFPYDPESDVFNERGRLQYFIDVDRFDKANLTFTPDDAEHLRIAFNKVKNDCAHTCNYDTLCDWYSELIFGRDLIETMPKSKKVTLGEMRRGRKDPEDFVPFLVRPSRFPPTILLTKLNIWILLVVFVMKSCWYIFAGESPNDLAAGRQNPAFGDGGVFWAYQLSYSGGAGHFALFMSLCIPAIEVTSAYHLTALLFNWVIIGAAFEPYVGSYRLMVIATMAMFGCGAWAYSMVPCTPSTFSTSIVIAVVVASFCILIGEHAIFVEDNFHQQIKTISSWLSVGMVTTLVLLQFLVPPHWEPFPSAQLINGLLSGILGACATFKRSKLISAPYEIYEPVSIPSRVDPLRPTATLMQRWRHIVWTAQVPKYTYYLHYLTYEFQYLFDNSILAWVLRLLAIVTWLTIVIVLFVADPINMYQQSCPPYYL